MRRAGLHNVAVLRTGDSNPYAYGEWLGAPGKPTVFLYAHHDVQPVNDVGEANGSRDPWTLTRRDGRLYGRGAADDKGADHRPARRPSPPTSRRNGSCRSTSRCSSRARRRSARRNLLGFFDEHKKRIQSDVIVVCDTGNIETGLPCITYSLRGIVAALVEVQSARTPVHSGMAGGVLADAALALNVILARLYWKNGRVPIPHFYDKVRPLTDAERQAIRALPGDEAKWRDGLRRPARRALRHCRRASIPTSRPGGCRP